ncbi:MAG: hypothetical protein ACKO9D_09460, partial [Gammaproteobacteria bacterium]
MGLARLLTRRECLVAGTAVGSVAAAPVWAKGARLPDLSDPTAALRTMVRMPGSLREQDVPWWFTGVIFA